MRFYDQATVTEAKGRPVSLLHTVLQRTHPPPLSTNGADSGALGCSAGWEAGENTNHGAPCSAQPSAGMCNRSRVPVSEPRIRVILYQ